MDDYELTWSGEPTEEDAMLDDASLDDEAVAVLARLELIPDLDTADGSVEGDVSDDDGSVPAYFLDSAPLLRG